MDPVPPERGLRPQDLVPALLAGDAEAVARWYRAEHPAVWRLCLGLLVQRVEADDAAQDAMLRLLDTLGRNARTESGARCGPRSFN